MSAFCRECQVPLNEDVIVCPGCGATTRGVSEIGTIDVVLAAAGFLVLLVIVVAIGKVYGVATLRFVVIIWSIDAAVMAALGYAIGRNRGRGGAGIILGLFLGPLGCGMAFFLPMSPEIESRHRYLVSLETERLRRTHETKAEAEAAADVDFENWRMSRDGA